LTGHRAVVSRFEIVWLRAIEIVQVENRATQHFAEELAFIRAETIEMGVPCHRLTYYGEELLVQDNTVVPVQAVIQGAMGTHDVWAFEMPCLNYTVSS
jgi:hypothetical protein